MATTEKIRRDIEKVREKITEQQKRLRALEAQLAEEENLEIVRMVRILISASVSSSNSVSNCIRSVDLPSIASP